MNPELFGAELARLIKAGTLDIADESAMRTLGETLARCVSKGTLWTLSGELGAGKSVLVRSIIHALGYGGRVKSPTYTLIETYEIDASSSSLVNTVAHLDLYRLQDPAELDYLGFDDLIRDQDLIMIEWPEQGNGRVPRADLHLDITYAAEDRRCVRFSVP